LVLALFFVESRGWRVKAPGQAVLEIVYAIADGFWGIEQSAVWFRQYLTPLED